VNAICYVDGFNLFHGIKELQEPVLKWLDLWTLAQSLVTQSDVLTGVIYFTAVADWNPEKAARHRKYIAALRTRNVEIVQSRFQKVTRQCMKQSRNCPFQEEKETDVGLATRVLADVFNGKAEKAVVISADTDQAPLFRQIKLNRPNVKIVVCGTAERLSRARVLQQLADEHKVIGRERLLAALLPRTVKTDTGKVVASCPAKYLT
jgi:uncharacterized LabA/DUF88 family protein